MSDFFRNSSKLVNRFTLILATAGLLVALFTIAGSQSDTVSGAPEFDAYLLMAGNSEPPTVAVKALGSTSTSLSDLVTVSEGDTVRLEVELTNAPEDGAPQDITVHLATGNETTASGSDYSYPVRVTIPQGQSRVEFEVRADQDDLVEDAETLNIYVSSVDYASQNYEQSDSGVDVTIIEVYNYRPTVAVRPVGSSKVYEGYSRWLVAELTNVPLGGTLEDITVNLATGEASMASEYDYRYPSSVKIPRGKSQARFRVWGLDDDFREDIETLNVYVSSVDYRGYNYEQSDSGADLTITSYGGYRDSSSVPGGSHDLEDTPIRIEIDNDNDEELPSVVIRPLSFSAVYEGVSKWLEVELTNRSEDNLVRDMTVTVNLATSNITTSDSDYSYPGSVMIPPGQNRVRFEVRTILDDLVEDSETLRIYASSIDYGGYNYGQSDLGINLIIFDIDDDSEVPPTVVVRPASDTSLPLISPDGIDRTSIIEGGELLLEVELTNAPRGGTLRDITVNLATGNGGTAHASDYNLPTTVTIPAGSVRGFFTVSARQDGLLENGETLNIYVSSVDYGGYNYEQSDSGLDLRIFDNLEAPIVRLREPSRTGLTEWNGWIPVYVDLINSPKNGIDRPITVHLEARNITTSDSDYVFARRVTINKKNSYARTTFEILSDDLVEFKEAVNIHVSRVDYGGRSYEQFDPGFDISTLSSGDIDSAITVQGGTEHPEGTTVTVRVHLRHQTLPAGSPDDSIRLEFALRGNVGARAVEVDGQPFVLESDEWPFYVDITEGLRNSSVTEVQFYLPDDYLPEQTGQVDLRLVTYGRGDRRPGYEARSFFRVVDDDEQPTVVLPDTDSDEPPIVAVRPISSTIVDDEQLLLLAVELTNAPEGGAAETLTVHLGVGIGTTAFGGGYNYPSSVTIPQGQSRVEFEVRAFNDYRDWIYKYDPIKDTWRRSSVRDWNLNIYARSVELGGRNYKQFDSGADFIIINHTELRASIRIRDGVNQPERSTVTVHVDLFKTLPTGFLPDNLVQLSFTPSGAEPFVVDITEALKGTGEVDVPAYFTGDYIPGGSNLVNVKFTVANQDNRPRSSRNKAFFRIVDKDIPPIVSLKVQPGGNWLPEALENRPLSDHSYVLESGAPHSARLVAELLNAPEGGALQDLVVYLGVGSESTASESDYSFRGQSIWGYPRIRIDAGSVSGYSYVRPEFDRVVEYSETIHIYVSSVEYLGQHHEQPNERVVVEIHNYNTAEPPIESSITVLGGVDHPEGTTVTVRVGLKKDTPWVGDSSIQMLPEGTPANAIELVFSMSGSVHIVDITEALRDSTYVDVPFYLTDDLLLEQTERVDLRVRATYDPLRRLLSEAQSFFRIVDDGEHLEVVPDTLTAQLSGSSLILYEDRAVTFEVELSGYLSSLVDGDTTTLTIEARPVEGRETGSILADLNDYELTPVTINKRAKLATFEIRTIDDSDYDPRESVLLELVSHSDDVEIGSPNTLNLEIRNNDPKPLISFATTLTTGRDSDGENFIEIPEGDKGTFRVELDRKSNRDVRVYVYLGPRAPQLWGGGVTYSRYIYYGYGGQSYYDNRGYYPGALNFQDVIEPGALVIPAGELGLTFTIDTTSLANDLYDYIQEDYLGTAFLYTISSAYTDERNGKVNFRVVQDEPIPELSFRSTDAGDATITVREGESFDVRVDIDPPLGRYNRAWNNVSLGLKLASQLIATTVTGEVPAWELPDIEIVPGQSGVTVTVQIPADGLANGERTVALDFEDALLSYTNGDQTVPARIKNSLVVTIIDNDEPPIVVVPDPVVTIRSLSGAVGRVEVPEGDTVQLEVELTSALLTSAVETITVHLATENSSAVSRTDYSYPSSVTIPRGQSRVTFEVRALLDDLVEDDETLNIYVSSVDFNSQNYEQSDAGVDLTIVDVYKPVALVVRQFGGNAGIFEGDSLELVVELANAPEGGAPEAITAHLATGGWTTASETDYSYPSSVTIPRGASRVTFVVRMLQDDWLEDPELLNVKVSSVDYAGRNYEQSDSGLYVTIISSNKIEPTITVLGGVEQLEGTTVTVRIALNHRLIPDATNDSVRLSVLLSDSIRAVSVEGQSLTHGQSLVLDIADALKTSTSNSVDVLFGLTDDYIVGATGLVNLKIYATNVMYASDLFGRKPPKAQSSFRIVDNDEPPVVVEPPIVAVRSLGVTEITEGNRVQLVVKLTNAPEGGAADDITVHLETGIAYPGSATRPGDSTSYLGSILISEYDLSYPRSVTIPRGQLETRFWISTTDNDWYEIFEKIFRIYPSSVEYAGQSYEQSDSGVVLEIHDDGDEMRAEILSTERGSSNARVNEGESVLVAVELRNAPRGGAAETVTVHLRPFPYGADNDPYYVFSDFSGYRFTLPGSDYSYPSSVTIPRGQSRVEFEVKTIQDDEVEVYEAFVIYINSIEYGDQRPGANRSKFFVEIHDHDEPIVAVRSLRSGTIEVAEGNTVSLEAVLINATEGSTRWDMKVYLDQRKGGTASWYDYSFPGSVTIPRGQNRVEFKVRATDDYLREGSETFKIYASSVDYYDYYGTRENYQQSDAGVDLVIVDNDELSVVVPPATEETITAILSRRVVALEEGSAETIRIDLDGDLSSLIDGDTTTLTIKAGPVEGEERNLIFGYRRTYRPADRNDYELTPVTVNRATREATFEIRAVDDSDYDPLENVRLEVESRLDDVKVISTNSLQLKIENTDPRPFVSFTTTLTTGKRADGENFIEILEGAKGTFRVELDRKSNRDIYVSVYSGENPSHLRPFLYENGVDPILYDRSRVGRRYVSSYFSGEGFRPGSESWSDIVERGKLTIPAGELGLTFTVDTTPLANEINDDYFGTVYLYINMPAPEDAYTDELNSKIHFRVVRDEPPVVVPPATEVTITATLERSLFTLNEGHATTFRIDLDGDLSSLVDGDTTTLAIKDTPFRGGERSQSYEGYSYNYLAADRNDYELTPVTINKQTRQATFGVRAIDEDEFDPLESVRLEVVSRSDDIRVVATNSLRLNIFGNDRRPFISFTTTLTTVRNIDGANTIKIAEGDKGTFGVVLDRKSNRSVEVHIYSNGDFRPFFDANGVDPIRYARTHIGRRYFEDMGFWPGNRSWDDVIGPGPLVIPAGELGLTFTVDTTLLENDLYDYIQEDYFGTVYLKMNHPVYAYTDEASSRVHFRVLQDEPTPELSFRSADDGDATITVREGESFDVRIDIDPELGRYHRVWNNLPGVSLASQLTATAVTGEVPAWELPDFEIVPGQPGVTVTVQVPADSLANGERTVALDFEDALLSYTRSPLTAPARIKNSLVVTILDAEPPVEETATAILGRSSLTLQEGRAATITVDLSGDLSSLVDGDTSVLTIEARPVEDEETGLIRGTSDIYLPAELNDYELTPVTIDKQAGQATFEVRAVDDNDYDPLESVMLELVSHSDDVQVVSPNSLKLKIGDNDPRPFVSFSSTIGTQRLLGEYATTDIPGSSVPEGEQGDFRVVLDRKSNRDVEFFIAFSGRPHLFSNDNEELVLPSSYIWTHGYLTEQGYRPGNSLNEWSLLRIPAGELGTTFTVDTRSAENDLYDYYWDRTISFGHIYVDKDHYAYTDHIGAKHNFFIAQDEPAPKLLLKSSAADDDGDATVTVSEGESFDVWVEVSHQFGTSVLFNEPDMNLKARLTATAITGAISNLDLPDVYIGAYQSGVTVTMRIPVGSFANGEGTVALGFGDVVQLRRGTGNLFEVSARVGNRLIVNVQGGDSTVASLSTSMLTLTEGQAATITVDLSGDLSSLVDGDTSVLTIEARPVEDEETGSIRGTSDIYLSAERNDYELTPVTIDKQAGQATFEIRTVDDSDYDPLESVMLELVSYSDDVEIVSPDSLKLKIENNDPRPFVSFSSTIGTQRLLGEYATTDIPGSSVPEGEQRDFRVVLDRKSNRDVEFFIAFSGRPHLFSNDNEELVLHSGHIWTYGYLTEQGYRPGNSLNKWSLLRIPAGELGTTFTVDTRSAENDLYDYYWDRTISFGWLYVDKDHYAYTDRIGARHNFFIAQDEPAPKLLLKSSAADDDGDATVTVSEGESFDVWVEVSHQFGTSVLFDEPEMNLKARLTATAITGAISNLDLPDVYIGAYQSGVTVTMRIPVGSFANGEGTVALGFGDVVQLRRGTGNLFEVSARVGNRLIVNVQGGDSTVASLSTSMLTLTEGQAATITVDFGGDLSSLVDGDTTLLTIEARPVEDEETGLIRGTSDIYLPAELNDYELTPVTIDKQAGQATFEVRAVDDNDYDPLESVMLELVSHSDDVEIVSPDSLKLKIENNDPRPFVSFSSTIGTQRLLGEYATTDIPGSSVPEGEQGDFRVVLDRKSNRDVEFFIAFSGRPHLFSNDNEELVLPSSYIWTHGYLTEQGYRPGNSLNEWSLLRIPAGELGTTFTVDTRSAENDLYDYYWDRTISFGHIYVDKDHYAYTDHIGAKHNFFIAQDEPAPKLLLKSSAADDDGDATVTVSEGESFDVWVEVSHQFGTSVLFNEPDMNLKARLTATAITGAISNLDLPDVYIGAYQSGVTVTMRIPVGSFANGEGTVALGFGDVVQLRRGTGNLFEVSARVGNRLIVNVQGGDSTVASLSTSMLTLTEGQAATITVDLSGDLSSLVDGDTTLLTIEASPVEGEETGLIRGASDIYLPAERNDYELTPVTIDKQAGQATFEIRTVDDSDYDPLESVMLELVSHSDDVEIVSPDSLKLKIENNDPRPFVSFTTTLTAVRNTDGSTLIKLLEGDKGTFRVVLDRESNRDVELIVYSGGKSSYLLGENGESLLPYDPNDWQGYRGDRGYWPASSVEEWGLTRIPAGELGLTFTVDTKLLDNDLYDYIEEDYFGTVYLYMSNSTYAYTDYIDGRVYFRVVQDEPIPELSFRGATDGDATITVREGESFDVWIDIDPLLGRYHRVRDEGVSLASRLTATAVIGEIPAWELPDFEIVLGQPGVTVTVQVPADSLANGERTVVLDFEDALLSYTRSPLTAPARIKNSLVVTILDAEPPVVSVRLVPYSHDRFDDWDLSPSELSQATLSEYVFEGFARSLLVELTNAPEGGASQDITVHLATRDTTTSESDYEYLRSVTIPSGQIQGRFDFAAIADGLVEYDENVNIYVSGVEYGGRSYEQSDAGADLTIIDGDRQLKLAIRSLSGTSTSSLRQAQDTAVRRSDLSRVNEGESVLLEVELLELALPDNGVDRDITFYLATGSVTTASGADYSYPSSVTIPYGQDRVTFEVRAIGDDLVEDDETLNIYVNRADYGGLSYEPIVEGYDLTIVDNEEPPIVSIRSLSEVSVAEGGVEVPEGDTAQLEVELTNAPEGGATQDITVNLATQSGTTASESDYSYPSSVTIPQGQSRVTFEVRALQDDLVEDDETLNIYVSSVDFNSQNYEQSDSGVNLTIVDVYKPVALVVRQFGGNAGIFEGDSLELVVELANAPEGGAPEAITAHLATGGWTTASETDYSYPSSVTIPRGASRVTFVVRMLQDDWLEDPELLNVKVSSVDYAGRNYEQSDSGLYVTIISSNKIEPTITVLGGVEQLEGTTVTVRIALNHRLIPDATNDSVRLSVLLSDSIRAVSVEGQSLTHGQSLVLDIADALKTSTSNSVDVLFGLTDDYIVGATGLVNLKIYAANVMYASDLFGRKPPKAQSSFRIVDNDEPPVVAIRSLRRAEPAEVSVAAGEVEVPEGDTVQLVAELTNAPEGGATQDITVNLATRERDDRLRVRLQLPEQRYDTTGPEPGDI